MKINKPTVEDLTLSQLETIIRWNENGNDTLGDDPYDRADLMETVNEYTEDMPLSEMCKRAGIILNTNH